MAIPIKDYVNVQITRATQGVSRQGFGTPMIIGEVSEFYDRSMSFSGISEAADIFGSTHDIYYKALAIFSQTPRPKTVKIGRKYANKNSIQRIVFNAAGTGGTFKLTIADVETAGIAYDANAATIKAACEDILPVTTVTVTEIVALKEWTIEFTGVDGNKHWDDIEVTAFPTSVTSAVVTQDQYGSATETWSAALDAICEFDDDFYAVCIDSKVDADISAIAANIQARSKIFIAITDDSDVVTSDNTNIASVLNTAGYSRTAVFYTDDSDGNHDGAWLGRMLPYQAGRATWAYKELEGENLTVYNSTQRGYALDKKANIYHIVGGKRITEQGTMANGEYIDNMISIDFLIARISEDVFQALTDADKIPYTQAGIGIIAGILEARLSSAANQGIINTYEIDIPSLADIATTERANRILPDVNFTATLQGAIHEIEINGKVSV